MDTVWEVLALIGLLISIPFATKFRAWAQEKRMAIRQESITHREELKSKLREADEAHRKVYESIYNK